MTDILLTFALYSLLVPIAMITGFGIRRHSRRYSIPMSLLIYISTSIVLALISTEIDIFTTAHSGYITFLTLIPLLMVYLRLFEIPVRRQIATFLFIANLVTYLYTINFTIFGTLTDMYDESLSSSIAATTTFVFGIIGFFVSRKILHGQGVPVLTDNDSIPNRIWALDIIVSILFIILNLIFLPRIYQFLDNQLLAHIFVSCLLFAFAIYCILFAIFIIFAQEYTRAARLDMENKLLQIQENDYHNLTHEIDTQRRYRHDMKHAMNTIYAMLEEDDRQGAMNFIKDFIQSAPAVSTRNYTPVMSMNALLNFYAAKITTNQIPLRFQIEYPYAFYLSETELCGLVGNILENAVEGCETLPPKDRKLTFTLSLHEEQGLFIVCKNTFDGKVNLRSGEYISTKRTSGGLGTQSMKAMVRHNYGTIRLYHEDKEFHVEIFIPNP